MMNLLTSTGAMVKFYAVFDFKANISDAHWNFSETPYCECV